MSDKPTYRTNAQVAWLKAQLAADACDKDHPYYVLDQMASLCRELEREVEQVRALAIAEAARIAAKHIREPDGSEFCAGESLGAKQIEKEIRALSTAPSVTEEWVWNIATTNGRFKQIDCEEEYGAVIDTLAALGVTVEGAAK